MKKYLLIGGTGTIGSFLTEKLLEDSENEIYITSRSKRKSGNSNIIYLSGNPHDKGFLKSIFADYGVFDTIVDFMVWSTSEFENIHELMLTNCRYYVYLSSSRIYANSTECINEETARLYDVLKDEVFLKNDSYAVPKAEQEDILKKSGFENYVIIRPYITYSLNRLPLCSMEKEIWLYRILHGRKLVMPKDIGKRKTSLTFGDDCAAAIYQIIIQDCFKKSAVNITTREFMTWDDVLNVYSAVLARRGIPLGITCIDKSLKAKNGDYQTIYDRAYDRVFDTHKLEKCIDVSAFVGMTEGLSSSLNEFLDNPHFNPELQSWGFQAQLDRITGEYAKRSEFASNRDYGKYLACRYLPLYGIRRLIRKCIRY